MYSTQETDNKWISPPPILRENPPNQAITNTMIIISNNPIFFTPPLKQFPEFIWLVVS
jgi:hypothetical protein